MLQNMWRVFKNIPINRLRQLATEGLLLAAFIVAVTGFSMALLFKVAQPLDLAESLPAEQTLGFLSLNLEDLTQNYPTPPNILTQIYGQDWLNTPGFGEKMGLAWTPEGTLRAFQISSRSKVRQFLEAQKLEKEGWTPYPQNSKITCFQVSHPDCYTFFRGILWLGAPEALSHLWQPVQKLKQSDEYKNARFHLSPLTDALVYLNLQKAYPVLMNELQRRGLKEQGYFSTISLLMPVSMATIQFESEGWNLEQFTAISKGLIGGQPYYRHQNTFNPELFSSFKGQEAFTFSGHELGSQLSRTLELLGLLNSAAELSFEADLEQTLKNSGHTLEELFAKDGEYLLSINENKEWTLLLQNAETGSGWSVWSSSEPRRQNAENQVKNLSKAPLSEEDKDLLLGADELVHLKLSFFGKTFIISSSRKVFDDGLLLRHHLTLHDASP